MINFTIPKDIEEAYDLLLELGVGEETLKCMTDINGLNTQTLNDVCYWKFGYRDTRELKNDLQKHFYIRG